MFSIQIQILHSISCPFGIIPLQELSHKGLRMIEYTASEYAKLTGFSSRKVCYLIQNGEIKSVKRNGRRIILVEEPIATQNKGDLGFIILKLKETIEKLTNKVESLEQRISDMEKINNIQNERRKPNGRSLN